MSLIVSCFRPFSPSESQKVYIYETGIFGRVNAVSFGLIILVVVQCYDNALNKIESPVITWVQSLGSYL